MRLIKLPYRNYFFCLFLLMTVSYSGCTQTKSYWILANLYPEKKQPIMGMTLDYMEGLVKQNTYLVKSGTLIQVDFPVKHSFRTDTVKSITYDRIPKSRFSARLEGKLIDSIYNISSSGDTLRIKFYHGGTTRDQDRFVIEYERESEAEYNRRLKNRMLRAKSQQDAVQTFITNYRFDPLWKTAAHEPLKDQQLKDSIGNAVVRLPKNFYIDDVGSLYVNTIDQLKVGTLSDNNVHYKVIMKDDKESFGDANLFMIKGTADKFDLKRYLAGKNFTVMDQDADSFQAVQIAYNEEKQKAEITNYISFRHFYKNNLHIIYLAEDDAGATDPVALAKRHYMLMKNLSVK